MLSRFTKEKWSQDEIGLARIFYYFLLLVSFSGDQLTRYSNFALSQTCTERSGVWIEIWLSPAQASAFVSIFYLAAFFSMIGLFTRVSMIAVTLASLILLLNSWKFCFFNHSHLPILLPMFFWALLDDHSSFRLDEKFFKKNRVKTDANPLLPLSIQAYFCVIFFLTGIAKLRSGFDWITSDSLKNMLIVQNFAHAGFWWSNWFNQINSWLVSQPWLCRVAAVFTIVVEISAPLALLFRPLRNWIVLHLAFLQIAIFLVMYINFSPWSSLYVFWLPLRKIREFSTRELRT